VDTRTQFRFPFLLAHSLLKDEATLSAILHVSGLRPGAALSFSFCKWTHGMEVLTSDLFLHEHDHDQTILRQVIRYHNLG
jgi:hypothetical protein